MSLTNYEKQNLPHLTNQGSNYLNFEKAKWFLFCYNKPFICDIEPFKNLQVDKIKDFNKYQSNINQLLWSVSYSKGTHDTRRTMSIQRFLISIFKGYLLEQSIYKVQLNESLKDITKISLNDIIVSPVQYSEYPFPKMNIRIEINPKNGRNVIYFPRNNETDIASGINFAKYIASVRLGRYLKENEQADHIDGSNNHDTMYNIDVLTKNENILKEHFGMEGSTFGYKYIILKCPNCGKIFERNKTTYFYNSKVIRTPLACSIKCSKQLDYNYFRKNSIFYTAYVVGYYEVYSYLVPAIKCGPELFSKIGIRLINFNNLTLPIDEKVLNLAFSDYRWAEAIYSVFWKQRKDNKFRNEHINVISKMMSFIDNFETNLISFGMTNRLIALRNMWFCRNYYPGDYANYNLICDKNYDGATPFNINESKGKYVNNPNFAYPDPRYLWLK